MFGARSIAIGGQASGAARFCEVFGCGGADIFCVRGAGGAVLVARGGGVALGRLCTWRNCEVLREAGIGSTVCSAASVGCFELADLTI